MKNPDKVWDRKDGVIKEGMLNQEPRETTISSTDQRWKHQRLNLLI